MRKKKCYADGGVVKKESADEVLARMNAKYGVGDSVKPAPPSPTKTVERAATPPPAGLVDKTVDAVSKRKEELQRVMRYAHGGVVPVVGKGSGISDDIPVVVGGQNIRLSNGEGVAVLPAKTMKNPAAVQSIEGMIEATNRRPVVRRMADGGVFDPEEQKRQMTNYVVPTAAPTAQEVYGSKPVVTAQVTAPPRTVGGGLASSGLDTRYSDQTMYGKPFSDLWDGVRKAFNAASTGLQEVSTGLQDTASAADTGIGFQDIRAARKSGGQTAVDRLTAPVVAQRNMPQPTQGDIRALEQSDEFRASLAQASRGLPRGPARQQAVTQPPATGSDARYDAQTGSLSFTDKTFNPTRQEFSPGTGAMTNARTGKTVLLTGDIAQPSVDDVDGYGNKTAITQQLQQQLATAKAANAAPRTGFVGSLGDQKADADRFDRFLRNSTIDAMARDLARGGGNARANAGKIAALNALVSAQNAEQSRQQALDRRPVTGESPLVPIVPPRQSREDKLRLAKMQAELDETAGRAKARNRLTAAIDSGNPDEVAKAWSGGVAAGIVKPEPSERPTPSYKFHTDGLGNTVRFNEMTGVADMLDPKSGAWKTIAAYDTAPVNPAERVVGKTYITPNGPAIWKKTGWQLSQ